MVAIAIVGSEGAVTARSAGLDLAQCFRAASCGRAPARIALSIAPSAEVAIDVRIGMRETIAVVSVRMPRSSIAAQKYLNGRIDLRTLLRYATGDVYVDDAPLSASAPVLTGLRANSGLLVVGARVPVPSDVPTSPVTAHVVAFAGSCSGRRGPLSVTLENGAFADSDAFPRTAPDDLFDAQRARWNSPAPCSAIVFNVRSSGEVTPAARMRAMLRGAESSRLLNLPFQVLHMLWPAAAVLVTAGLLPMPARGRATRAAAAAGTA
ncbi:MAG: hypothetical protein JOZ24_09570, partial [Candidatus Eremiobacteraeota bacterium]|nr:hypothetical protein [Candidatus Eremiobacteraeota bacterium]